MIDRIAAEIFDAVLVLKIGRDRHMVVRLAMLPNERRVGETVEQPDVHAAAVMAIEQHIDAT